MAEQLWGFGNASASLIAGANITLSSGSGNITIIGNTNSGATTFLAGVSTLGNSSGATGMVNNQLLLVGGNNITLSESSNGQSATVTISGPTGGGAGMISLGNSAGTTGTAGLELILVGGSNISLSQSLNASGSATITINGVAAQTSGAQSLGVLSLGNTDGTTGYASGDLIDYVFVGSQNITLSQSVNGASGTVTIWGMIPGESVNPVSSANYSGSLTQFYAPIDHKHAGIYSAGVSTFGNTFGSTAVLPGQIVFAGLSGISLSQSTNASNEMTVSFVGFGGAPTLAYISKSAAYTAAAVDNVINVTAAATITLPTASGITGKVYSVKNSGLGSVTVTPTGGETIDGAPSVALAPLSTLSVVSDGTNWIII
jgi:hypothetical protein